MSLHGAAVHMRLHCQFWFQMRFEVTNGTSVQDKGLSE